MKAAVLYGNEDIRYTEWPDPELRPGCVRIKVKACGICGSDVPRVLSHGAHFYPIVLGHEFSGVIDALADDVTGLEIGDHVAGVPLIPCMKCEDCQKGNFSQCKHYSFIGSREQGAFADYVVIPAQNVVKVDPSLCFEQVALFEPCTVALHGVKLCNYRGGGTVAVLGGGTIGLFALQWAQIYGAAKVVVFGRSKDHLEIARKLGADAVISTLDHDFKEQAMSLTNQKGFDYVFETAGSTFTMKLAFDLAANHSSVCFIGTPTQDLIFSPSEWEKMNRKEFSLTGSWMSCSCPFPGNEWTETAHFFANGSLQYLPEMFHRIIDLKNVHQAVNMLKSGEKINGRILLVNS